MTLQEAAEAFGTTASMVCQIIHRRKYPSRILALRILEVTGIPICRLYDMPACAAAAPACAGTADRAGKSNGEAGGRCG